MVIDEAFLFHRGNLSHQSKSFGEIINPSRSKPGSADIEKLRVRLDRMHLVVQTLLTILAEKKIITEDEFRQWLHYVDELDGRRDGRLAEDKEPLVCGSCRRKSAHGSVKCQYCGAEYEARVFARSEQSKHGAPAATEAAPPGGGTSD